MPNHLSTTHPRNRHPPFHSIRPPPTKNSPPTDFSPTMHLPIQLQATLSPPFPNHSPIAIYLPITLSPTNSLRDTLPQLINTNTAPTEHLQTTTHHRNNTHNSLFLPICPWFTIYQANTRPSYFVMTVKPLLTQFLYSDQK